ncbi:helix-turn-helix domain-containing protein [Saltatorellus ferox]
MKIDPLTPQGAILEELGKRLGRVRKRQGMTQEALAEAAGLGVATVRRIEDGSDSQLGSWIKLLKALGMEASIEGLLPESYRSPMEEALGGESARRGRSRPGGRQEGQAEDRPEGAPSVFRWGDERV